MLSENRESFCFSNSYLRIDFRKEYHTEQLKYVSVKKSLDRSCIWMDVFYHSAFDDHVPGAGTLFVDYAFNVGLFLAFFPDFLFYFLLQYFCFNTTALFKTKISDLCRYLFGRIYNDLLYTTF